MIMNYADIETFLELVRTRNLTKAAEHLFLSQSTVSNRLRNLENELGFSLFLRGKGRTTIELTRKGEEFAPIAERWRSLYEETELVKSSSYHKLRIASSESSYFTLVSPFIREFGSANPQVRFDIRICDSEQIYDLADKGLIHFGFVSYEASYPRLVTEKLLQQELCVIMHTANPVSGSVLDPTALDPAKEIRFSGGRFSSMDLWREKYFGTVNEAALTINVGVGAIPHMRKEGMWSIVPVRMARFLSRHASLQVFSLPEQLEPWQVFMVRRKDTDPNKQDLFKHFISELLDFVNRQQP